MNAGIPTNTEPTSATAPNVVRHKGLKHGPMLRPMSRRKARRRACTFARRHNRGLRATGGRPR